MKILICFAFIAFSAMSQAAAIVRIDRVQQRYPWNGYVDIDYTVSGVEGDPNDYRTEFFVSFPGRGDQSLTPLSNFVDHAWCDLPSSNGAWRVTWNGSADRQVLVDRSSFSVRMVYDPVTAVDADYAIVDLTAGADGIAYPVRYVRSSGHSSDQFNRSLYKTRRIAFKKVKAGEFWMGDGNVSSGTSRFRVRLTRDYFLGVFPITQRQYLSVVGGENPARFKTVASGNPVDERPAENITYHNLTAVGGFIELLSAKSHCRDAQVGGFALPTEAEWEYACRAGTETAYPWGDDFEGIEEYAWWCDNVPKQFHYTQACGGKLPNAWGFYDMIGNVWEWTRGQCLVYPPYSEEDVVEDPVGEEPVMISSVRGGAAGNLTASQGLPYEHLWRSGNRVGVAVNKVSYDYGNYAAMVGFRLVFPVK